jgi:hypothetical protein
MLPIGSFFFNEHFKFDCRQAVRPFITLQGVTESTLCWVRHEARGVGSPRGEPTRGEPTPIKLET